MRAHLALLPLLIACLAGAVEDPAPDRVDPIPAARQALPGLPNFFQVSPVLYRGAQPSAAGMQRLVELKVKTVVSLRAFHSDRDELAGTGLGYERISFKTWHPEEEDILRFLAIVNDPARQPVFVHCLHGADRTGTMCAIYRMVVQGWSKEQAIAEMTGGGFGFHSIWQNLIRYIRALDIDALRTKAGIPAPVVALAPVEPIAPLAPATPLVPVDPAGQPVAPLVPIPGQ